MPRRYPQTLRSTARLLATMAGCALVFAATHAGADGLADVRVTLDPDRVSWQHMSLKARKLFLTADTEARLTRQEVDDIVDELIEPERGNPVQAARTVMRLESGARFFGKKSETELLMNPLHAQALQYAVDEDGDRIKHRIYRYTDSGIFVRTHRPDGDQQYEQPWQTWSTVQTEWRDIAAEAHGQIIVDPLGLLYIVGAAELEAGGQPLEFLSISDRKVTRVSLTAQDADARKVDFQLRAGNSSRQCKGQVPAIQIRVEASPLDPASDKTFQFLGLEDDIEIYVEPATRLVLEISGKAPIVGHLVIRLQDATVAQGIDCPLI